MSGLCLAGKTALITGASRGIGLGITCALAKMGVHCILLGRNLGALEKELSKLPSGKHNCFVGDIASVDTWNKFEHENACIWLLHKTNL